MGKFVKIPAFEVGIGMFVAELDCPWQDSPFLLQGFTVQDDQERHTLMELCDYVIIDSGKSPRLPDSVVANKAREKTPVRRQKYTDQNTFDQEIVNARTVFESFESSVSQLFVDLRSRREINMPAIQKSVEGIVSSVISNPDACMLLQKMRGRKDYLFDHATGTAIWTAALCRQLGMPKREIAACSMAGLLCDTGMVSVPDDVLHKADRLTTEDRELVKGHVVQSLNHIIEQKHMSKTVLIAVKHHHERFDGTGYPAGLKGEDIPFAARVLAICDSYDAMTNHRVYCAAMSPAEAVRELNSLRNIAYQDVLVDEFIQAVGLYPVGTLVELTSGEVGMVVAEYRYRRLRPRVVLLADADKNPIEENRHVDLSETGGDNGQPPVEIVRSLEEGAYGLETDDLFI